MKKSLFILFFGLIFIVSCDESIRITPHESENDSDEIQNDEDTDTEPASDDTDSVVDDNDPVSDDGDSIQADDSDSDSVPDDTDSAPDETDTVPDEDSDTAPHDNDSVPDEDADTAPNDNDSVPDEDTDTAEEPDEDAGCAIGSTKTVKCTGLPQNAEWNTANYIEQTCETDGFSPSNAGEYNPEPVPSETMVSEPESIAITHGPCPEGTAPKNGNDTKCVECGRIIPAAYIEESDAGTVFSDNKGKTAITQCFNNYNPESGQFTDANKPCCGSGTLYRIKDGEQVELPKPYSYNDEALPNNGLSCSAAGYLLDEASDKCYKCIGADLKQDGDTFSCSAEIGSECRFKCKNGFNWINSACKK